MSISTLFTHSFTLRSVSITGELGNIVKVNTDTDHAGRIEPISAGVQFLADRQTPIETLLLYCSRDIAIGYEDKILIDSNEYDIMSIEDIEKIDPHQEVILKRDL